MAERAADASGRDLSLDSWQAFFMPFPLRDLCYRLLLLPLLLVHVHTCYTTRTPVARILMMPFCGNFPDPQSDPSCNLCSASLATASLHYYCCTTSFSAPLSSPLISLLVVVVPLSLPTERPADRVASSLSPLSLSSLLLFSLFFILNLTLIYPDTHAYTRVERHYTRTSHARQRLIV